MKTMATILASALIALTMTLTACTWEHERPAPMGDPDGSGWPQFDGSEASPDADAGDARSDVDASDAG